ncbi:hypothetical protein SNEBB_000543 [Seison nebaliae]|nr:hypothetical protein SNEBB_000543 [Seison nebaliae]
MQCLFEMILLFQYSINVKLEDEINHLTSKNLPGIKDETDFNRNEYANKETDIKKDIEDDEDTDDDDDLEASGDVADKYKNEKDESKTAAVARDTVKKSDNNELQEEEDGDDDDDDDEDDEDDIDLIDKVSTNMTKQEISENQENDTNIFTPSSSPSPKPSSTPSAPSAPSPSLPPPSPPPSTTPSPISKEKEIELVKNFTHLLNEYKAAEKNANRTHNTILVAQKGDDPEAIKDYASFIRAKQQSDATGLPYVQRRGVDSFYWKNDSLVPLSDDGIDVAFVPNLNKTSNKKVDEEYVPLKPYKEGTSETYSSSYLESLKDHHNKPLEFWKFAAIHNAKKHEEILTKFHALDKLKSLSHLASDLSENDEKIGEHVVTIMKKSHNSLQNEQSEEKEDTTHYDAVINELKDNDIELKEVVAQLPIHIKEKFNEEKRELEHQMEERSKKKSKLSSVKSAIPTVMMALMAQKLLHKNKPKTEFPPEPSNSKMTYKELTDAKFKELDNMMGEEKKKAKKNRFLDRAKSMGVPLLASFALGNIFNFNSSKLMNFFEGRKGSKRLAGIQREADHTIRNDTTASGKVKKNHMIDFIIKKFMPKGVYEKVKEKLREIQPGKIPKTEIFKRIPKIEKPGFIRKIWNSITDILPH